MKSKESGNRRKPAVPEADLVTEGAVASVPPPSQDEEKPATRRPSKFLPDAAEELPVQFKKAVEAIHIRVNTGKLTLTGRKLYNVLLFHAQEQGIERGRYEIPLSTFVKEHDFVDHIAYLKDQLRKLASTTVEWDLLESDGAKQSWTVASLLSTAKIEGGKLTYTFNDEVRAHLLMPTRYQRMDLRVINQFRKGPALALYENTVRFVNNTLGNNEGVGLTSRAPWEKWADLLSDEKTNKQRNFKYWKRDVLTVAVDEINAIADIEIEPIIFKNGREISDIQFKVTKINRAALPPAAASANPELVKQMMELGCQEKEAVDAYVRYGEEAITYALEDAVRRINHPKLDRLTNPAKWFMAAVRKRVAELKQSTAAPKEKPPKRMSLAAQRAKVEADFHLWRAKKEEERFKTLPKAEKDRIGKDFEVFLTTQPPTIQHAYRLYGYKAKVVSTAFYAWLESLQPWTEGDLIQYMLDTHSLK